jgi:uncharacterized membrane protein
MEIERISKENGISREEAAISLNEKIKLGEVSLIDPDPPQSYTSFLLSFYSSWFWLVVSCLLLMWFSIYLLPQIAPFTWLRVGLGFLTSLYLPGYVFIEVLYPKRDDLEELERFALSVGLSIALTPLLGFVLNYTPWGIRLNPITASISFLTLFLGLTGVYRKYQYHMLRLELQDG